ncbi:non-ribosomal peptide synthetase [Streptomyces sp. NBC_01423]|uniref:non-ribosomal peptide synthetase n=1 Tax=Streptomyces sp. NBC_01423 TaxID=2903860 RepID=UPI002E2BB472|nr:non-ribosomal peptide synthetase [Streptomyces sp. NBC_01423]
MSDFPELIADRARPPVGRPADGRLALALGEKRAYGLDELARAHGTTRFAILLTAYRLLIGRSSGTRDVTIVAGPPGGDLYPTRETWDDGTTFAALLDGAPGEPDAAADIAGPGAVVFAAGGPGLPLGGRFDLACLWEGQALDSTAPHGLLAYNTDLFERATVERFRLHYLALLDSALATAGAPVRDLTHTTSEERELLASWGRRPAETSARTVVETFRAQAGRTPDAVALRFADGTLDYGTLQERATLLAERLTGEGVTPESVVALAMEPSAALVTAMIAVLTTGAAYLPLDPGHPDARLAHMLADSGACLVLADRDLPFAGDVPVLRTDRPAHDTPGGPGTAPAAGKARPVTGPHPDQRACVLYTSGSTGRPKGVAITHRGIVRLVHDAEYLGLGPSDVVAQVANTSFDAATFEIWAALLNGARLVGVAKDDVLAPERLRARIAEHGVTAMLLTTVLANRCAEHDPAMFAPLRTLFFGGEAADTRRVTALRRANPGLRLINAYGPTEGTTIATVHPVSAVPPDGSRLPIGRPIADTRLHVLDPWGRETGIGVPGELHLGGAGLARGYVGRPDLTAERFVPSTFGHGERLYRTGDIVRWREDGELEYLGRADSQIKIRGVRIEPEEIAGALTDLPAVRAAVVDVRGDGDDRRLVGYVTTHDGLPADPAALHAGLAARLPAAMVPSWYVTLPALPVTPNGKVDRRALPEPTDGDRVQAAEHVAPRNAAEETVARVWAELLGLPRISVHDDFLALGGHSLLATRAVARLAERLGVEIGVRDLFEAPTVARFAARAAGLPPAAAHPPVPRLGSGPHQLSFAQQRLWFLDRLTPGSALYNVPLDLEITGRIDLPALRTALQELLDRHEVLRTRFAGGHTEPRQVVDEVTDPLTVTELAYLPEDLRAPEAGRLAREEALHPFDLAAGPLFRARLLRLAEDRARLLLTMHHTVFDGWSVGVLIRDLGALYAAAEGGRPAPAPLPVRYADYAAWQREHLAGGAGERQLAYWRERLHDAPPALDLPVDRPRPAVPRYRGDTFPVRLGPELTRRLDEVCRTFGVTRFMVLMAAFQLLLGRYSDTRDVTVGAPVSGRVRPDFEDLVGFFVNTVVIRTRWEEELTFAALLGRVKEVTLGAYAHQDVPFEQVVDAVRPPRQAGRAPLFQTMLAMQNVPRTTTALTGLDVTVHESAIRAAKFDLTVVWDEGTLTSGALGGYLEYDTDLFDPATAERLAGHYLHLLEAALGAPQTPLLKLSAMSGQETADLVGATDRVPRPYGEAARPVHELISAVAAARPDQPAISQAGQTLSYAELDEHSERISVFLRARGIGHGAAVVVRLERTPLWPATLLGILKAGATYVPTDPQAPQRRFTAMLDDARAALVLGSHTDPPPTGTTVPFAAVEDVLRETIAQAPESAATVHPRTPAYVLYTSGTTGRPKGVVVSHSNLTHTIQAVADRYDLGPRDRVLQFAALTFDVAAEELFSALVRGATVVLPPGGPVPGIDELTSLVRSERLTVLNLPASYWHEWVAVIDRHPPTSCPTLRLVVTGSERVDGGKLAIWRAATPGQLRWLNAYGPTEATITATVYEPDRAAPRPGAARPADATVPIGRPLPGVRAYVLDAELRPVPIGVAGDLHLAGDGIAQGYLGDPARTAAAFLPDPWGRPGARMYATGDRARRGPDGELEFLGRGDDQIKLRGFRIDLGEIEAALAAHPDVRDAAVLLREDTPGRPRLVGYIAVDATTAAPDLQAHLAQRLPGYMVPSAVVPLDRLPRGERGKTDRRALPAPGPAPGTPPHGDRPDTALGRTVAAVWRDVLGLEHIGSDDNFFDLGGHSLLMLRVQTRLAEELGRDIPVVDLFGHPTVRTLARHLANGDRPRSAGGSAGRRRAAERKLQNGTRTPRRRAATPRDTGDKR